MAKSFKSLVKKTATAKTKRISKKRTKQLLLIEKEIEWYHVRKSIADAMRKFVDLGFEFSGHGCGFGGEDFSLSNKKKDAYVNFCDKGKTCVVTISTYNSLNEDGYPIELFKGTICKAIEFAEKL